MAWQSDESLLVGNVVQGVLKLSVSAADGREQTLGIMFPSDFISRPFGSNNGGYVPSGDELSLCRELLGRSAVDADQL